MCKLCSEIQTGELQESGGGPEGPAAVVSARSPLLLLLLLLLPLENLICRQAASSNPLLVRAIYGQRAFVSCHRCPQMAKLDMLPKEQRKGSPRQAAGAVARQHSREMFFKHMNMYRHFAHTLKRREVPRRKQGGEQKRTGAAIRQYKVLRTLLLQILLLHVTRFRQIRTPPAAAMMQEGLDDGPDFLSEEDRGPRAVNVDLQTDATLQVDISDALSERDKVKFTVHTKTTLPNFKQNEFSVVRQHEEFIWLHDSFVENEEYAGYIIPPAPPRPDFDASREKLQKLGEGEGSMTKEEFTKMKQELEAEYLAIFKKTVAMHEVFLCRVAAHPVLRKDLNFHVFLEYNQDLSVRGKNKKEKLEDFFKNVVKSADGVLVAGVKDVDDFFEHEKTFLIEYHNRVKDASLKSDRMIRSHKSAADDINRIASSMYGLGTQDSTDMCKFFLKVSELFEKTRKIEARVAADEDLKLADLLKYYLRESQAAKDLLYRRGRALVDYENANKALDKARAKNKEVLQAETTQQLCCQKFEKISESAKQELIDFKTRRVAAFRKNLVELAELELKHAKGNLQLLQSCLGVLKGDT
ncbi:hypothetical protein ACEWY4_005546 [Coilia grayii]|uniref:PX domain-containing protein n=1 Tax=Coilia grayii TaxID=363190 RepID=A0ABD1KJ97_9TELE